MAGVPLSTRLARATAGLIVCVSCLSLYAMQHAEVGSDREARARVWWSAWLTALSTGLGALPFAFVSEFGRYWVGVCNSAWRPRRHGPGAAS